MPKTDFGSLTPRTMVTASVTTISATAPSVNFRDLAMKGTLSVGLTACIMRGFQEVGFLTADWKTHLVTTRAVNIEARMPATSVTAKPRMRPEPTTKRMTPVITVVRLPSKIALKARS